jgi:hypothetical protein
MEMTYSDFISLYLEKLADQWRDWRKRREHAACIQAMEVCDSIVNNELANKAHFQTREMILRKELGIKEAIK